VRQEPGGMLMLRSWKRAVAGGTTWWIPKRQQKRLAGAYHQARAPFWLCPAVWAPRRVGFRAAMRRWRCGPGIGITARTRRQRGTREENSSEDRGRKENQKVRMLIGGRACLAGRNKGWVIEKNLRLIRPGSNTKQKWPRVQGTATAVPPGPHSLACTKPHDSEGSIGTA
jgi:hypothetical protein